MPDPSRQDESLSPKPSDPTEEKDQKVGWIDRLAQRSTGLPGTDEAPESSTADAKSAWRYAGVGLQFAATTALFTLMGYGLDRKMGWSPWGTVGLTMVGLIGGLYLLIKEALRDNETGPADKRGKT